MTECSDLNRLMKSCIIHVTKGPTLLVNVDLHVRTVYKDLKVCKAQISHASCCIGRQFLIEFASLFSGKSKKELLLGWERMTKNAE